MNRMSRLTVGALLTGAALLSAAPAQAEIVLEPAAELPTASPAATGSGGLSTESAGLGNFLGCVTGIVRGPDCFKYG